MISLQIRDIRSAQKTKKDHYCSPGHAQITGIYKTPCAENIKYENALQSGNGANAIGLGAALQLGLLFTLATKQIRGRVVAAAELFELMARRYGCMHHKNEGGRILER
jgi:hypothetical protein